VIPAAQEIARGAHPAWVDVGLRNESSPQQRRDFLRIDTVVLGIAAMDRPHVEGVAQHKGNPLSFAEVGEPIPGKHALDADHHIFAEGFHRQEKRLGIGADIFVHAHLAVGIHDAEIHPINMQVDAAVKRVLNRVESHRVSSLLRGMRIHLQDTG
jgi:hypothetical protein